MFGKLQARFGRPLATGLTAEDLVVAMTGSEEVAITINDIWDGIKPKADDRYLQNTKVYATDRVIISPGNAQTITKNCPSGWQALGGGVDPVSQSVNVLTVVYSGPMVDGDNLVAADPGQNPAATGWKVRVHNGDGASSYEVVVGVICAK